MSEPSGPMSRRFSSSDRREFFFEPFQLHLQLPDLPVEVVAFLFPIPFLLLGFAGKGARQVFQGGLLPEGHEVGRNVIFPGDLSDRFLAPDGFEGNAGLDGGFVFSPQG